jgi:hypothetical protein
MNSFDQLFHVGLRDVRVSPGGGSLLTMSLIGIAGIKDARHAGR